MSEELITEDDREQALNLAVVLGIHEQSAAMTCLLAAIARLRNESYADGYGSGLADQLRTNEAL